MTRVQATILASKHFLSEQLPQNWKDLDESELFVFLDKHQWDELDDMPADWLWAVIDNLATDFMEVYKKGLDLQ